MAETHPLLSIVIPSYNQGAYIPETLESCVAQSYRPIEIIVMDGRSTDNTVEVLKSFDHLPELTWVSEPDEGVVDAVNKGMARASGSICAIQSSDDRYLPGAFEEAVQVFQENADLCLVYGDTLKVDASGREISRFSTGPFSLLNFLSKRTIVLQPAAFFTKNSFDRAGGWSPEFFNADTECWLRMILQSPAKKINAYWAERRMHETQRDREREKILASYEKMMKTNPDLQNGPLRWKMAARCGLWRHRIRYRAPSTGRAEIKRMMLRAAMAWPPVLLDEDIGATLVPGYFQIRKALKKQPTEIQDSPHV